MSSTSTAWIAGALERRLAAPAWSWWNGALAAIAGGGVPALALAIGQAARRCGRAGLVPDATELTAVAPLDPSRWSVDQLARAGILAAFPAEDPQRWLAALDAWFATGTVEELVAAYQALPLLPHPHLLANRAAEGIRSNMGAVFQAVALDNPYPAAHLPAGPFRQMVLKACFVGADLDRITGLEARIDAELQRMLSDYARERRLASRSVDPRIDALMSWERRLQPAVSEAG